MKSLKLSFVSLLCLSVLQCNILTDVKAAIYGDQVRSTLLDLAVGVDLNRDGEIEFSKDLVKRDSSNEVIPTDLTSKNRPYRFWINNDLDVVNYMGDRKLDWFSCAGLNPAVPNDDVYQQVCEEWDEDTEEGTITNTIPSSRVQKIESHRDLEDFSPLSIKLIGNNEIGKDYELVLSAKGININLFEQVWEAGDVAHSYIINPQRADRQVWVANYENGHVGSLYNGRSITFNSTKIKKYFDDDGIARFIFEGLYANADNCNIGSDECYLLVEFYRKGENGGPKVLLAESKLYLDLRDVKHFYERYSAGEAGDSFGDYNASYVDTLDKAHEIKKDIFNGIEKQEIINENYILFVHGWRMELHEINHFSDTAYKRLYWSGYKGRFGAFTWPTGWYNKPPHVYDNTAALGYIINNITHYDISEAVARRVGANQLYDLLTTTLRSQGPYPNIHVVAHSMGNIVVSEALRQYIFDNKDNIASIDPLIQSYSPSEAASVSGAYDQSSGLGILHELVKIPVLGLCEVLDADNPPELGAEASWRCYNNALGTDFDMPPDMYRSDYSQEVGGEILVRHGPTTDIGMATPTGQSYYHDINRATIRMVNFNNPSDAALSIWELNQLNKPSKHVGSLYKYSNGALDAQEAYDLCLKTQIPSTCVPPSAYTEVTSRFSYEPIGTDTELHWSKELTEQSANILARIVPARSMALGQVDLSETIAQNESLEFTNSNQDHSAQFHGYYAEPSPKPGNNTKVRARYWNLLLLRSLGFTPGSSDYSGLENNIN